MNYELKTLSVPYAFLPLPASLPFHRSTPQYIIRNTRYDIRNTKKTAKRAAIHAQNPKKIKKFSDSLTPYPTMTYLL